MNISHVIKSPFTPAALSKFREGLFERLPNITVNREAFFCNLGRVISRPDVGRGILGATAILTQPLIDYYNPKVDRDTAEVSTCRTIGKILAGTAVGVGVRSACYYGIKALTSLKPDATAIRKLLLPSDSIVQHLNIRNADWIKNYRSYLASIIGLVVMLGTNVLLDVPLTNLISKKLLGVFKPDQIKDSKNNTNSTNPTQGREVKPQVTEPYDVNDRFREVFIDKFEDRNKWRAS